MTRCRSVSTDTHTASEGPTALEGGRQSTTVRDRRSPGRHPAANSPAPWCPRETGDRRRDRAATVERRIGQGGAAGAARLSIPPLRGMSDHSSVRKRVQTSSRSCTLLSELVLLTAGQPPYLATVPPSRFDSGSENPYHMPDIYVLIQTGATVITALAAIGVFGLAYRMYRLVLEHDRVLFGEEAVQGWNGIVPMVQEHEEQLSDLNGTEP